MIDFNGIIEPIEKAIIEWSKLYPLTVPLTTLQDLTNAQFFILLLSKVDSFKFLQPCSFSNFVQVSLGERIGRMKMAGRSIVKYYKFEMMKDVGDTSLNYIQMCSQNNEELMKLIIMFMGIIVTNSQILSQLEKFINHSQQENTAYLNIMVQYARTMVNQEQQSRESSPVRKQKRLITKLEILQEQIQFYQDYTKQLQTKVQQIIEDNDRNVKHQLEQSTRRVEMLKKIEELESNNDQMLRQINKKTANEDLLSSKLSKNRQLADQTINRLLQDIEKLREQLLYYKKQVVKYEQVESINKSLTSINQDLRKDVLGLKQKLEKHIQNLHKKDIELQQMHVRNNSLILENDGLKVKLQLLQKQLTNNRSIHFSPQQKSVVFHNPLSISTTSNQNNFMWFNFKQTQNQTNQNQNDSLTLTLRSNTSNDFKHPLTKRQTTNKENCISLANQNRQYQGQLNNICEQKSFELNMESINSLMKFKQQRDFQLQFAVQAIANIYDYMESLRKQLNRYQSKEAKQLERTLTFKKKVNTMFS